MPDPHTRTVYPVSVCPRCHRLALVGWSGRLSTHPLYTPWICPGSGMEVRND